ncbi:hypothetical protein NMY22_g10734 [Coprinellus aureogranulatus]|nr:hypothetical protein NMY22_g10734 [Coprinellus aureogranulatus]
MPSSDCNKYQPPLIVRLIAWLLGTVVYICTATLVLFITMLCVFAVVDGMAKAHVASTSRTSAPGHTSTVTSPPGNINGGAQSSSVFGHVYCLAQAANPKVRCTPECRKVFAPRQGAGFMQALAHDLECWGI